jgi:spermidine synthase
MEDLGQVDIAYRERRRRIAVVRPRVYEDGDSVTLQFQIGEVQSQMLTSDPNFLVLSYTRTMMAFMLFNKEPNRIAMIGLGGGSMPKWCYHELPKADITVIEINQMVISLREQFYIPADDDRFRVICGDGADYVADTTDSPEVLLVDGFDVHGQPPQLCSQELYDDCYRALATDGLLVVNLCGPGDRITLDRIRRSFDDRVLVVIPRDDDENRVVFAVKGERLWITDEPTDELVKRLRSRHVPCLVES